ncbi:MAG: CoA transferase [Deltaproteobacteria bacterium]|jgi:crotonobetainyl-CoA:carnitine CoA-transferase CaiB-like acyl-CoA transferase|nr:CoA transferase [Deltaproteobacteria bacterium]MBW2535836.1 CoA transferase [Deltaproteobacteria bacterium]
MPEDHRPIVLSVEQALSMSYATLRFVHEGYRVIRVEPTPVPSRKSKGDPNRYIGRPVAGEDRHSYYVAPNAGKEAIAVDCKKPEGQALIRRLVRELPVDVFCTNTLLARHGQLGIDYEALCAEKADLIWCSISAMGPKHPKVPGYDPVLQALCGYMDLTGAADGPPMQCGPPFIDLKAGDEAFVQCVLALCQRERTGQGRRIDVSMAQVAVSWLHTFLPMLDMGSEPSELRRNGNEHRQFIPVNAYRTADGFVYLAIGSDAQWARFVEQRMFAPVADERYGTNEGRRAHKGELFQAMEGITSAHSSADVSRALAAAGIPHAPITPIEQVADLDFVKEEALRTVTPDGRTVRLPPAAVTTEHLERCDRTLPFAPAYGESTDAVLGEVGLAADEIAALRADGVVA